ncbi:XRE family transcriptional regulator [Rhodococcus sp. BUPNP1]|uniref:helix-turn-helix domain-containing protein n=1 Tax=Rhodococcus sp. BUPNP1 TaxID=1432786 RepID=UPI000B5A3E8A|nr:XRE family transcriptional regulator [Rhodococcus sp. BUPNP1]OWY79159.1 hypothetical protein B9C99_24235 [Rhodococcus sp. BUPNP1]
MKDENTQEFSSVWDALADTPAESENLKLRSSLMIEIVKRIEEIGWSQRVAAANLGVTQPRISDICRGKIDNFTVESLLKIARPLGIGVHIDTTLESDFQPESSSAQSKNFQHA